LFQDPPNKHILGAGEGFIIRRVVRLLGGGGDGALTAR